MKKQKPFLFIHNQFNPYAKTKGAASLKTRIAKAERNRGKLFYDSLNEWDMNPKLDKPRRKPYVRSKETLLAA